MGILDISGKRLKALFDNLVAAAGLESGLIETQFADMRIGQVIDDIITQHQKTADEKQIQLLTKIAPSARCLMRSDASVIHGVLEKLIENAIKFTPQGQINIEARMEEDSWLHVIV